MWTRVTLDQPAEAALDRAEKMWYPDFLEVLLPPNEELVQQAEFFLGDSTQQDTVGLFPEEAFFFWEILKTERSLLFKEHTILIGANPPLVFKYFVTHGMSKENALLFLSMGLNPTKTIMLPAGWEEPDEFRMQVFLMECCTRKPVA